MPWIPAFIFCFLFAIPTIASPHSYLLEVELTHQGKSQLKLHCRTLQSIPCLHRHHTQKSQVQSQWELVEHKGFLSLKYNFFHSRQKNLEIKAQGQILVQTNVNLMLQNFKSHKLSVTVRREVPQDKHLMTTQSRD